MCFKIIIIVSHGQFQVYLLKIQAQCLCVSEQPASIWVGDVLAACPHKSGLWFKNANTMWKLSWLLGSGKMFPVPTYNNHVRIISNPCFATPFIQTMDVWQNLQENIRHAKNGKFSCSIPYLQQWSFVKDHINESDSNFHPITQSRSHYSQLTCPHLGQS